MKSEKEVTKIRDEMALALDVLQRHGLGDEHTAVVIELLNEILEQR